MKWSKQDWDLYRNGKGEINLVDAFKAYIAPKQITLLQLGYLATVMDIRPVVSRQVAALALASAASLEVVEP